MVAFVVSLGTFLLMLGILIAIGRRFGLLVALLALLVIAVGIPLALVNFVVASGIVDREDAPTLVFYLPVLWVAGAFDAPEDNAPGAQPSRSPERAPLERGIVSRLDEDTRRRVFERLQTCAEDHVQVGNREELVLGPTSTACLEQLTTEYRLLNGEIGRILEEGTRRGWSSARSTTPGTT